MAIQVLAGYWDFNLETRELLLCPRSRRMFGFAGSVPKRLASYDWQPRIHPDDMPTINGRLESAGRHNEVYAARFRALRPDGSICWILGVGRATARNPKRFVGLNFDLNDAADTADRVSRSVGRSVPTLASGLIVRSGPANENESRPWRAWSPGQGSGPRNRKERKASEREFLASAARAMLEVRELRRNFFSPAMLGEPAFDLLLVLYTRPAPGLVSVEALSALVHLSASVATRWLRILIGEGLVLMGEEADAGACVAALTDKGRIVLDEYFRAAGKRV